MQQIDLVESRAPQKCAYCQSSLTANETVRCQECGVTLHLACVAEVKGCVSPGCRGFEQRSIAEVVSSIQHGYIHSIIAIEFDATQLNSLWHSSVDQWLKKEIRRLERSNRIQVGGIHGQPVDPLRNPRAFLTLKPNIKIERHDTKLQLTVTLNRRTLYLGLKVFAISLFIALFSCVPIFMFLAEAKITDSFVRVFSFLLVFMTIMVNYMRHYNALALAAVASLERDIRLKLLKAADPNFEDD